MAGWSSRAAAAIGSLVEEVLKRCGVAPDDPFPPELAARLVEEVRRNSGTLRLTDLTWPVAGLSFQAPAMSGAGEATGQWSDVRSSRSASTARSIVCLRATLLRGPRSWRVYLR
jgi:hypothetical protein